MRAPEFWTENGLAARLLAPLGAAYHLAGVLRRGLVSPQSVDVPVICIGNLVAGGAGKTPVALALIDMLRESGLKPAALTRGYGGSETGPLRVQPGSHDAAMVGDEALLLAAAAPTWLARDRVAGARKAVAEGADVIVMDDGFQNPGLKKDLSLLVVDGTYGFGNGRVIPAGPLRETTASGLARADAVVLVGGKDGATADGPLFAGKPVLRARLLPRDDSLAGQRVFAFAGIGRPGKFFQSLRDLGAEVVGSEAFADHQPYDSAALERLRHAAKTADAKLVTTAKDAVRLGPEAPRDVTVLHVTLTWDDENAVTALLAGLAQPASDKA